MTGGSHSGIRADIQMLRAWAILCVIAHHAKLDMFAGGYLGVDVFFVISGYLITRTICFGINAGNFALVDFYAKRFKRLLPAAYAVFMVVALLSPWILDPQEEKNFLAQLGGALTFTANMVLWRQSGYFDSSADFKPLLHIWSLSLEEQYYFVLPIFLLFLPRRWRTAGLMLAFAGSFWICAALMLYKPNAGFYFLPSRAWELLAGSLIAQLPSMSRWVPPLRKMSWAAWAGLLLLPLFPMSKLHPGWDAAVVCMCTAVILAAARISRVTRYNILPVRVGNGSYCLYLVHWPLFAWLNSCFLSTPPLEMRFAAVFLTFMLAWLLRKYVEQPGMRLKAVSNKKVFGSAFVLAAIIGMTPVTANMVTIDTSEMLAEEIAPVTGLSEKCSSDASFGSLAECRHGKKPRVLLWGDSYAMHLVPGMQANATFDFIQAARVNCSPLLDIAQVNPGTIFNLEWARDCIGFNRSVANFLQNDKDIDVVIVASPFDQNIITNYGSQGLHNIISIDGAIISSDLSDENALAALGRTINAVRSAGKKVLLVAAPPRTAENMARCSHRKKIGLPLFKVNADCSTFADDTIAYQASVRAFLHRAEAELDVAVFYPDEFFCAGINCRTQIDGKVLYRDNGHYSREGSVLMAEALNFSASALALAR